jgi:hypothetical protein
MKRGKYCYPANEIRSVLSWERANELKAFVYPWSPEMPPEITFRALWDKLRFYFRFDVVAPEVLTYVLNNNKMEVVHSDRVEIFFRSDARLDPYYCLEMDPLGRVLDYRTRFYRQFEYQWQWPGKKQLLVRAAMTESGYWVEGSMSLGSLRKLGLLENNRLQAGLYRGQCLRLTGQQAEFKWISWVRPDSERPDFHIPSSFGTIELVTSEE